MAFYCNGKQGICDCDILCADCKFYDDKGGKDVKTNADRIRAMSDEELVNVVVCPHTDNWDLCKRCCVECRREWLQQPAEVE